MNGRSPGLSWRWMRLFHFALFALLQVPVSPLCAAKPGVAEHRVKAAFIFTFTKFVRWPEKAFAGQRHFTIAVPERSKLEQAMVKLSGKLSNGRPLRVKTYREIDRAPRCHVLVADPKRIRALSPSELAELGEKHILTVGDGDEFFDAGGIISILVTDQHLAYRINLPAAKAAKLELHANLLKLAVSSDKAKEKKR
ncbi:MAG: hypothetical protein ACI9OD_003820 [Limisphaerales bacterium]|jgi:hypothetical protein